MPIRRRFKRPHVDDPQLARILQQIDDDLTALQAYAESLGGGGAAAFTDLTDAPASYVDQGGKAVKVKATADGLEFGASAFTDLTDTPAAYADKAKNAPRVNAGETALEFVPLEDERIRFCHVSDDPPGPGDGENGDVWLEY